MAYLPPHKRHSDKPPEPTPVPSNVIPQSKQALTLGRQDRRSSKNQGPGKIVYAPKSVSRWLTAGSSADDPIPASIRLEPFDCEVFERTNGGKPLVIRAGGEKSEVDERPWVTIAERVEPYLIECYQSAIEGVETDREVIKLNFVARMGKVLFLGNIVDLESIRKAANAEGDNRQQVRKAFHTNISSDYMDKLENMVMPKIGCNFDSEKEHYHVKVFDKSRQDSTISCKCTVASDGRSLEIYKIELNQVRHLLVDVSCLYNDLDLRLMLLTKRIVKTMDDEESEGITKLVQSAVIDPDVKGGLRWPIGEESVGDRFSIVGAWHTKYKAFKNDMMRIYLRHADRFDHRTSTGEVSTEVMLKLTGISKILRDGNVSKGTVKEMVQDAVKFIWDHFLS